MARNHLTSTVHVRKKPKHLPRRETTSMGSVGGGRVVPPAVWAVPARTSLPRTGTSSILATGPLALALVPRIGPWRG